MKLKELLKVIDYKQTINIVYFDVETKLMPLYQNIKPQAKLFEYSPLLDFDILKFNIEANKVNIIIGTKKAIN